MGSTAQWLVALYPFTIKLIYEKLDDMEINEGNFYDLTEEFIGEEFQNIYNDTFYSLRLSWSHSGIIGCPNDEYSPLFSSRHSCAQTSGSGYALFDISNGGDLPTRNELGNKQLELFRRGEPSRSRYQNQLNNNAESLNMKEAEDVYFTLNVFSNSGLVNTTNKNGQIGIGYQSGGGSDEEFKLSAITVATMIAAGAVIVLILTLFYAWKKKEWYAEKAEALDARSQQIYKKDTVPTVTNLKSVSFDNESQSTKNIQSNYSGSMMGMSTMDEYSVNPALRTYSQTAPDIEEDGGSIVSMESYGFSVGDMLENGSSRAPTQRSVRFLFDDQTAENSKLLEEEQKSVTQRNMYSAGSF